MNKSLRDFEKIILVNGNDKKIVEELKSTIENLKSTKVKRKLSLRCDDDPPRPANKPRIAEFD